MRNIIEIAKREFYQSMPHDGVYVDLYNGGGFEALDLAKYAPEGKVYSFGCGSDLDSSCKMYENYMLDNIRLINDSSANIEVYLSEPIDGAVCRLNGSMSEDEDKLIIGINKLLARLKKGGRLIFLHQKIGHNAAAMLENLWHKEYSCVKFASVNDTLGVSALLIEKV